MSPCERAGFRTAGAVGILADMHRETRRACRAFALAGLTALGGCASTPEALPEPRPDGADPPAGAPAGRSAADWVDAGVDLRAAGDVDGAERAYNEAIKLDPKLADAWFDLGNLMLARGRFSEAADTYERATGLAPADAQAWINLGHALMGLRKFDQAAAAFTTAAAHPPEAADAWNGLGAAFHAAGDRERALQAFTKAVEVRPDGAEGLYNLGMALADAIEGTAAGRARYDDAIGRLEAFLASDAGKASPYRSNAEHRVGKLQKDRTSLAK